MRNNNNVNGCKIGLPPPSMDHAATAYHRGRVDEGYPSDFHFGFRVSGSVGCNDYATGTIREGGLSALLKCYFWFSWARLRVVLRALRGCARDHAIAIGIYAVHASGYGNPHACTCMIHDGKGNLCSRSREWTDHRPEGTVAVC